ncbi:hypothetical protein SRABI70_03547 [Pseudomonas sp. Bi70]|nr:hypothetical protein SRABI70_03547 [Pseudomonas sp. Bi70]
MGDLAGAGAVGEHAVDQLADVFAQRSEGFHPAGVADGTRQVHQVDALQGEQVALGHHAAQLAPLYQADVGDMPLGHGDGGVEGAGVRRQMKRRLGHQAADRLFQGAAVGHRAAQIAQGEDALRAQAGVDDDDAADLLFVHQPHSVAQRHLRGAGDRLTHRQFAQARVERVLRAKGFHRAHLHLLVDLVEQAADAAQGEIAQRGGLAEQPCEGGFVEQQAEGVFGGQMGGAGGALADQRGHGKTLAAGDLEGGFRAASRRMGALAVHAALLDDVQVLYRAVIGVDDHLVFAVEAQLAMFDQIGEVRAVHLVEGREFLQELHGAMDVLAYRRLAGLDEIVGWFHCACILLFLWCHGGGLRREST